MSAVYATQSFCCHLTTANVDVSVQQGAQHQTTDAIYTQTNPTAPYLWSATAPVRGSIPNALFDFLAVTPGGV